MSCFLSLVQPTVGVSFVTGMQACENLLPGVASACLSVRDSRPPSYFFTAAHLFQFSSPFLLYRVSTKTLPYRNPIPRKNQDRQLMAYQYDTTNQLELSFQTKEKGESGTKSERRYKPNGF